MIHMMNHAVLLLFLNKMIRDIITAKIIMVVRSVAFLVVE